MVEKIRFEGVDREVIVDFNNPHTSHSAVVYAFDEHRAVLSLVSDDGFGTAEVLGKLGEHRFTCKEIVIEQRQEPGIGY